jgi:Protein of unknown function (DUF1778)
VLAVSRGRVREHAASCLLTIRDRKHGGSIGRKLIWFIPEQAVFTSTRCPTEHIVGIVRDAMRIPKEQRETARDAGSAFSISETFVFDERAWEQFLAALDSPSREIPELVKLFRAKAPWD